MNRSSFFRTTLMMLILSGLGLPSFGQGTPTVRRALPVPTATPAPKATPSPKRAAPKAAPKTTPKPKARPHATPPAASPKKMTPPAAHTLPTGPRITYTAVHVDGPYVALTFDDGPHKTNTPRLLDMLKERKIPVTFFVLGELVKTYPEIARRIVAEGHEIGSHTWAHPNLAKMGDAQVRSQLDRTQAAVKEAAGVDITVFRPPYGSLTDRQRHWIHNDYGYKVILWDVDPLDWRRPGADVVASRILDHTRPGSIILVHDIHPGSVDAMPKVLDTLLARGYHFVTVSQLIAMEKFAPAPSPSPSPGGAPAPTVAPPAPAPVATPASAPSPGEPASPAPSPAASPIL